jgi:acyl-coenzyme A thioesterase PaaI-like protein
MKAKQAQNSRTTITELMIPSYANFGGKIHGGILLSLMDKVAYATATKHSGAYCVTVSVTKYQQNTVGGQIRIATNILSRGYNTCDTNNPRRIERGLEMSY